jgi:hypothetical protein
MKPAYRMLLTLLAVALAAGTAAAEKAVTVEGTLVDGKCYLADASNIGDDHGAMKQCGKMCLMGGSPAGVLTKEKKFHALIAPSPTLADYVGRPVRVSGPLHNGSILTKKVEVKKEGRWEEVKLGGMM